MVLSRVHETLRDSVRMGFLHSSRARGRVPQILNRVSDVRFLGHGEGPDHSTILRFEAPVFGTAAPELFDQGQLWEYGPHSTQTAFDLLAASLHDVRLQARDSERFDSNLLRRLSSYRKPLHSGLSAIALPGDHPETTEVIDEPLRSIAQTMFRETPSARRVRLMGRLDLLRVSTSVIGLLLEDGTLASVVWATNGIVDLASYLNRNVLVEGLAAFRPSGRMLRVDADAIRLAGPGDSAFGNPPTAPVRRDYRIETAAIRLGYKPYEAIFGALPGDESDEEFAVKVEAIG